MRFLKMSQAHFGIIFLSVFVTFVFMAMGFFGRNMEGRACWVLFIFSLAECTGSAGRIWPPICPDGLRVIY